MEFATENLNNKSFVYSWALQKIGKGKDDKKVLLSPKYVGK
jgi:hypothetical protein